jgi:alpha-L-fucosidase
VSNHSSHAWHWWQTAYGYDAEGPMRGRRYDAYWLRKHHRRGQVWDGLDPQELYTGPYYVAPAGIASAVEMDSWHDKRDGQWLEAAPAGNIRFVEKWLLRQNQLVDDYKPDLMYFDDLGLPFGQAGLDAAAHFYSQAAIWHGTPDVVITGKTLQGVQRRALVDDVERGFVNGIRPEPWQTDTCIGNWHYDRRLYDNRGYKSTKQVIQRLADVVSKNGNLLLNIPVRGDGTIDSREEAIVDGIAAWMSRNGEAIYGTRPWRVYGEGPTRPPSGPLNEQEAKPFTSDDIRFTRKGDALYAIFLDWPQGEVAIKSLGQTKVERLDLFGGPELCFTQGDALRVTLPAPDGDTFVPVLRIRGAF